MQLLFTVIFPILCGALMPLWRFRRRLAREIYVSCAVLITSLLVLWCAPAPEGSLSCSFLHFTDRITCSLRLDGLGRIFACMIAFLWPMATLYAFEYMEHEKSRNSFFAWYTMAYGITLGIAMAGDAITLYLFYELLTLVTLPLVMHGMEKKERMDAGLKYLYYSLFGAGLAFAGIMLLLFNGETVAFVHGGVLSSLPGEKADLMRLGYVLVFLGLGVKAAVFPFHGWLVSASAAPTPVTALLHAVAVVKAGVFAVMRLTYFSFGPDLIRGTFAQWIPLGLAAFTVVFGAVYAVRERHFKRRLVYSTISNLSYILMGTLFLNVSGLEGAILHMVYHAVMKISLFCVCGAVMIGTGAEYVSQWRGLGKSMPLSFACFVLASLAMVGIPPLSGFHSKWSLAMGAVGVGGLPALVGCTALAASALLSAVYLLLPCYHAWFTPRTAEAPAAPRGKDPSFRMCVPLTVWALTTLALSLFNSLYSPYVRSIAESVL